MRVRTIKKAISELRAADPGTALNETALRRMILTGEVEAYRIGQKYLVDLDRLEAAMFKEAGK